MRKIPLGVLAAAALTAGMALTAAPATAGVATTGSGSDCAPAEKTVHHDAETHKQYQYWKVAQVWKDGKQGKADSTTIPGDDVAQWDYSTAAKIMGQTYVTQWYDKPQTEIYYAPANANEGVDKPFWMGSVQGTNYTGWYTYHLKGTQTVTDKKAYDETVKGEATPCASPTPESEAPKPAAKSESPSPALQPVTESSPSASAAVPTSIDAGLAGDHAKDTKIPALWPVFALAGAAVIVLGLIIVMRRRRTAVDFD